MKCPDTVLMGVSDIEGAGRRRGSAGDKPIAAVKNGKLDRAAFAKALADFICSLPDPSGFVIGLAGQHIHLNFVEEYLGERGLSVLAFNSCLFTQRRLPATRPV